MTVISCFLCYIFEIYSIYFCISFSFIAVEVVNRSTIVGLDGTVQVNIAGSTVPGAPGGPVSHVVGQHKPSMKGLVFDETIQLIPNATVTVYRCPDSMCR